MSSRGAKGYRHPDLDVSSRVPRPQLGHIRLGTETYPLTDMGNWSATDPRAGGAILYHQGQVVTHGGVQYVCKAVNTNDAPPSGNWDAFNEKSYFLNAQRVWAKIPTGTLFAAGGDLTAAMFAPASLECWYRLGDFTWPNNTGYHDSGFGWVRSVEANVPDSSSHGRTAHTTHLYGQDPAVSVSPVYTVPTRITPGALSPGSADEGASGFYVYENGDLIHSGTEIHNGINAFLVPKFNAHASLSVWIKFVAMDVADPWRSARLGPEYYMPVAANYYRGFSDVPPGNGWALYVDSVSGGMHAFEGWNGGYDPEWSWTSSFSLIPDRWYHFVYTIAPVVANTTYQRTIYLNTNIIYQDTSNAKPHGWGFSGTDDSMSSGNWTIGYGFANDLIFANFVGGIDEFATWNKTLTQGEVNAIFGANIIGDGDTFTPVVIGTGAPGTVGGVGSLLPGGSGTAGAGEMLQADGSSGTTWAYPPLHIYNNGT